MNCMSRFLSKGVSIPDGGRNLSCSTTTRPEYECECLQQSGAEVKMCGVVPPRPRHHRTEQFLRNFMKLEVILMSSKTS
jgi:hypothetical protein